MSALPLGVEEAALDPLAALRARNRRLADVVRAVSRRRDVRATRARLLLLLLRHRCPLNGERRRAWYVPGAVARMGAEGIRETWPALFPGVRVPSLRTVRSHLAALEQACAVIRSPGDFMPVMAADPKHRPRHADTLHVLETERDAEWWANEGRRLLEKHGDQVRHHPEKWARVFGDWRRRAKDALMDLFHVEPSCNPAVREPAAGFKPAKAARELAAVIRRGGKAYDLLTCLHRVGIKLSGKPQVNMISAPRQLIGAVSMLVRALERGDPIDNPAGWLVSVFRKASPHERGAATARVLRPLQRFRQPAARHIPQTHHHHEDPRNAREPRGAAGDRSR